MEKDYAAGSQCMDSLGQYYRGISTYNSTENKNILEFADKLLPNLYYVNNTHLNFRQIAGDTGYATLLGIKYLVSKNPALQDSHYELIRQFGSLCLYKNREYSSFAKFYTKTITASEFESAGGTLDTEALLSQYLITEKEDDFSASSDNIDRYTYITTVSYTHLQAIFRMKLLLHPGGTFFSKSSIAADFIFPHCLFNIFQLFAHIRRSVKINHHSFLLSSVPFRCYLRSMFPELRIAVFYYLSLVHI